MKKIIFLAIVASIGGFLFGFDTAVISGTTDLVKSQYALDDVLQGWYVSSGLVGCVFGVIVAGFASDKFGRKKALLMSAILFSLSAVGCAVASDFTYLVTSRLIGGIGVGVASMLSPMYISEIAPQSKRGMLTSLYQLAITVGILIAFLSNAFIQDFSLNSSLSEGLISKIFVSEQWRGMLGAETIPALLFFVLLLFIPASPRWLQSKGRTEEADAIIKKYNIESAKENQTHSEQGDQSKKYFKNRGIRIAIIAGAILAVLTQTSGINAIMYYGNSILQSGGADSNLAFQGQVLIGIINVLFTFIAIFTIDKIGRKKLLYIGVTTLIISLFLVGLMFYFNASMELKMLFILTFVAGFAFSYGPVIWVLLSELYPTEIRGRAMSIAVLSLWIANTVVGQLVPWLRSEISEHGIFWLFAIFCLPTYYIAKKYLPETKGKSLEEIEEYWMNK
ncbi:sugar porter family MFS transporter [Flavivirga eckloniae]|uniref:MFS transporter n=1 Tax=Flavivirga eckloniae TaxID=1803846 RepID=A0A2K9PU32_9FLAO|nr:sugar porter family MFS transporter [Flavivirga eckloniae]AUP80067.1 MFS transporter [Flavivirga eckloniae]